MRSTNKSRYNTHAYSTLHAVKITTKPFRVYSTSPRPIFPFLFPSLNKQQPIITSIVTRALIQPLPPPNPVEFAGSGRQYTKYNYAIECRHGMYFSRLRKLPSLRGENKEAYETVCRTRRTQPTRCERGLLEPSERPTPQGRWRGR